MGILCWSLVEETPPCLKLLLLSAWQLLLLASQKLRPMLTLTCFMVDMVWDILDTIILMPDMDLATMAKDLLMLNPKLMLTPTFFMVDMVDMDSDMLDTIILPMDMLLIMARGLLMPSPRLMLILIFSTVDIMDLVMVFTILPMVVMLTMERDLPMLNPRPMLTPTFLPWLWTRICWIPLSRLWLWTSWLLWQEVC